MAHFVVGLSLPLSCELRSILLKLVSCITATTVINIHLNVQEVHKYQTR